MACARLLGSDRQHLPDPVNAIREFRKFTDESLTLRGAGYAQAVHALNKAIEKADLLL